MAATLELESTLTDRYQTTVPDAVRRALKLGKRDKIRYLVQPGGSVVITRAAAAPEDDPVLDKFLSFLAHDIESHPGRVRGLDAGLAKRIRSLVKGVKVDLDAELAPEDE
ncbi:MAG: regulator [Betaproteobacteria bacterium RIFCSPLOWO2_12_FULL_62_58]|nr:MAG: regulator [Betaproteobacteria bacterium RIFCSPLOWO2_12_FULL_62_58]